MTDPGLSRETLDHPEGDESTSTTVSLVLPLIRTTVPPSAPLRDYAAELAKLGAPAEMVMVDELGLATDEATDGLSDAVTIRVVQGPGHGWGQAVRAGLAAAEGGTIAYANPAKATPAAVGKMLGWALHYPGVVLRANRRSRDSLLQRFGSLLFNLECRMLLGVQAWDVAGTPKVVPAAHLSRLRLSRDDGLIDVELALACQREGFPVLEIPVEAGESAGGRTPVAEALRLFAGVWRMRGPTG